MNKAIKALVPNGILILYRSQKIKRLEQKLDAARQKTIHNYLETNSIPKLQVGCGENRLPGWLNTDIQSPYPDVIHLDVTEVPWPLPSDTFFYFFCEHLIEHLTYEAGEKMVHEVYRVLKPDGRFRLATPNLDKIIELRHTNKSEIEKEYIQWFIRQWTPTAWSNNEVFVINNFMRNWGHQFIFTPTLLTELLTLTGFTDIQECQTFESNDNNLSGIDGHGKVIPEKFNVFETFILEGRKP